MSRKYCAENTADKMSRKAKQCSNMLKRYICLRVFLEEALRFTLVSPCRAMKPPQKTLQKQKLLQMVWEREMQTQIYLQIAWTCEAQTRNMERATKSRLRNPAGCLWFLVFLGSWVPWLYCAFTVVSSCFSDLASPWVVGFLRSNKSTPANRITTPWQQSDKQQEQQEQQQQQQQQQVQVQEQEQKQGEQRLDAGVGFPSLGLWIWSQE